MHHGDGVEEAFYSTPRVMTVSFHKYGEYFPGTGELRDIGVGPGKHHAINFPLRDGIDDASYKFIFEDVIKWVMTYYQPSAVVLQCGGDSLSGDRLGCFNLSMRGHANCVNFVKSFNLPTLILGGGGYTMRNVARTWAFETGQLVGVEMGAELPFTDYYEYYSPDFELDVRASNMENANSPEYLNKIKQAVHENLRMTGTTSVQMQHVPRNTLGVGTEDEDGEAIEERLDDEEADAEASKDRRYTQRLWDKKTAREDELMSESEDEEIAEAAGVRKQPGAKRRRGIMDHTNPYAPADESGDEGMTVVEKVRGLSVQVDGAAADEAEAIQVDAMVVVPAAVVAAPKVSPPAPVAAALPPAQEVSSRSSVGVEEGVEDGDDEAEEMITDAALLEGAPVSALASPKPPPQQQEMPVSVPIATVAPVLDLRSQEVKEREAGLGEVEMREAGGGGVVTLAVMGGWALHGLGKARMDGTGAMAFGSGAS